MSVVRVCAAQSCPTLCDPMDCSLFGSSVHGFSRQEYWSGLPFLPPGDLPNPGIKSVSPVSPALAGRFFMGCMKHQEDRAMLGGAWFQGPCTWTGCIFSAEEAGGPGGTCRLWWQRGYGRRWWREATGKRDKEVEDTGALYSPSAPVPPLLSLLESASANKSYRGIRGGRRGSFLHLLLTRLPLLLKVMT